MYRPHLQQLPLHRKQIGQGTSIPASHLQIGMVSSQATRQIIFSLVQPVKGPTLAGGMWRESLETPRMSLGRHQHVNNQRHLFQAQRSTVSPLHPLTTAPLYQIYQGEARSSVNFGPKSLSSMPGTHHNISPPHQLGLLREVGNGQPPGRSPSGLQLPRHLPINVPVFRNWPLLGRCRIARMRKMISHRPPSIELGVRRVPMQVVLSMKPQWTLTCQRHPSRR